MLFGEPLGTLPLGWSSVPAHRPGDGGTAEPIRRRRILLTDTPSRETRADKLRRMREEIGLAPRAKADDPAPTEATMDAYGTKRLVQLRSPGQSSTGSG